MGDHANNDSPAYDGNEGSHRRPLHAIQTDDPGLVTSIDCYRWSPSKTALFIFLSIISVGLLPLFILIIRCRGCYAQVVRLTHDKCPIDKVTKFLVKLTGRSSAIVCPPALIIVEPSVQGTRYKTLTPINRRSLSIRQKSSLQDEFLNENDSAHPFEVHVDQHETVQAGVDLGENGMFVWNQEKHIFQRLEPPPPYSLNEQAAGSESFVSGQPAEQSTLSDFGAHVYQQTLLANDATFVIELYRASPWKTFLFALGSILSGSLLAIICSWRPSWRLTLTCDRLDFSHSHLATWVKLTDATLPNDNVWIRKLWLSSRRGVLIDRSKDTGACSHLTWRFFIFECMPFVIDPKCNRFVTGPVLLDEILGSQLQQGSGSYFRHPWARRVLCGFNVTPVRLTPIWLIIWHEGFTPLYLFQFGCCAMWFGIDYRIYAGCLVAFAFGTIAWSVYMTYSNEHAVWHAVVGDRRVDGDSEENKVTILSWQEEDITRYSATVDARNLLPGDVVFLDPIPDGKGRLPEIPADLVLMKGSCLVDESMLSGEVTPVTKFASAKVISRDERPLERHILHCGTKLLSLSAGTVGMVLSIGFATTRGRLVRAVLRPTPADRRFTIEAIKFLGALGAIGFAGFIYSLALRIVRNEDGLVIFIMCIALIAVVIPPQTSVGLTIAQVIAQARLKTKRIFCTNPKSITPTGNVDVICFDKTGTLTEEDVKLRRFSGIQVNEENSIFADTIPHDFELCAACCNSVILLPPLLQTEANMATGLIGDPIDLELLALSKFTVVSTGIYFSTKQPGLKIELVKNFGFSAERRSSCVIARVTKGKEVQVYVFLKGAPEHVLAKCVPSSIPQDINDVVADATSRGLRLILLASKRIGLDENYEDKDMDAIEANVQLLGISFFENGLKPETKSTIAQLHNANLRSLMITGDDVRTALSTARQCGIVSENPDDVLTIHEASEGSAQFQGALSATSFIQQVSAMVVLPRQFAVTEEAWQVLRREADIDSIGSKALKLVLERGAIFARFRPDQKAEVITEFRSRCKFVVAMVGDGANDCCALKAADVGIALTEAEASLASAFTCKDRNIAPVIDILKEGRCSLSSAFGLFSVMVSYSCIQFCSACHLYWFQANCTELEFLYIDLFLLTTLSIVFPTVPAFQGALSIEQPTRHLLSYSQIAPIVAHNIINVGFQVLAYLYVQNQHWFLPYTTAQDVGNITGEFNSFEVFSLYSLAIFQYLTSMFVFARGAPFRSSFTKSGFFTGHLALLFIINHFIVIFLPESVRFVLKTFPPPSIEFRVMLVLFAYINLASSYLVVRGVQETVPYYMSKRKRD